MPESAQDEPIERLEERMRHVADRASALRAEGMRLHEQGAALLRAHDLRARDEISVSMRRRRRCIRRICRRTRNTCVCMPSLSSGRQPRGSTATRTRPISNDRGR